MASNIVLCLFTSMPVPVSRLPVEFALQADQRGELAPYIIENAGRHLSGIADRPRQRVDASYMAGQNLAGNRQPRRQRHAHARGPDARGYRAHDREFGCLTEFTGRDAQCRAMTALLAADSRIEIGPDQVAGFGRVGHAAIPRPRGPCPAPNRMPRAWPPGALLSADPPRHNADGRA